MRLITLRASERDRNQLAEHMSVLDPAVYADLDPQTELPKAGARILSDTLSAQLIREIQGFDPDFIDAMLIDNLPLPDLIPDTPVTGFTDESIMVAATLVHLGVVELIGATPYNVVYENSGQLLRNVAPVESESPQSSWGYTGDFFWHTDNPNLPFGNDTLPIHDAIPRLLVFQSIRNTERVPTEMIAAGDVAMEVGQDAYGRLCEDSFNVDPPESGEYGSPRLRDVSLFVDNGGKVWARFDPQSVTASQVDGDLVLREFVEAMKSVSPWSPILAPGQMLILDNYTTLHQRRRFVPEEPRSQARWLRRVYASYGSIE